MSNTYFQFKQFTIHQEQVAMKVCTDACLFGAWVARHLPNATRALDIGTGTGLLPLIYAQQNLNTIIDAVEIDAAAAQQANENIKASPWSDRITVHPISIQQFEPVSQYDLIITNPPFFENDLRSSNIRKNNAMHDTSLTFEELIPSISKHFLQNGIIAVLIPYHRTNHFITLMEKQGLHLNLKVAIKQSTLHNYFRSIVCFKQQQPEEIREEEIVIKKPGNTYTEAFIDLLKGYYLYL